MLIKDLKVEWRTKHNIVSGVGFGIISFMLVSIISVRSNFDRMGYAMLFWLTLTFAALLGMPATFAREEEKQTASMLRLVASPSPVFLSKWLHNTIFTCAVLLLLFSLAVVMWGWGDGMSIKVLSLLAFTMIFAVLGLTVCGTLLSALVARAKARSQLMVVLAFPLLLPLLIPAVECTAVCLSSGVLPFAHIFWFALYLSIMVLLSLALFEYVWH